MSMHTKPRPPVNKALKALAGRLKRLETQTVPKAARDKVSAWNVLDHGVAVSPFKTTDQSANWQSIVSLLQGTGHGGKHFAPAGIYTVNDGIVIPENSAQTIEGEGSGWGSNLGRGTMLRRRVNPASAQRAMVTCQGSDAGNDRRALLGLRHLYLHGGYDAGVTDGIGLSIGRGQENWLEDVRIAQCPLHGAILGQIFNASFFKLRVTHCGDATHAAVKIGAQGAPGNTDGTVKLDIFGLQLEQNRGVDLHITGNSASLAPSTEVNIIGGACEGGIGNTKPYHLIDYGELINFVGHGIVNHRTVPPIVIDSLTAGAGEERLVSYDEGCWIIQSPAIANPDYFIEVLGGGLKFHGTITGRPNIAYVHIGPDVRDGAVDLDFDAFKGAAEGGGLSTQPTVFDER